MAEVIDIRRTPVPEEVVCAHCGFPITGTFRKLRDGGVAHAELAHCDQLAEAHETADFIDGICDQYLTDALTLRSRYAGRGLERLWALDLKNFDGTVVTHEQTSEESFGAFLLRVTGGLVR